MSDARGTIVCLKILLVFAAIVAALWLFFGHGERRVVDRVRIDGETYRCVCTPDGP